MIKSPVFGCFCHHLLVALIPVPRKLKIKIITVKVDLGQWLVLPNIVTCKRDGGHLRYLIDTKILGVKNNNHSSGPNVT